MYDTVFEQYISLSKRNVWQRMSLILLILLKFSGAIARSSCPEVFLRKSVLKICSKFTEEHPCGSVISIKLQSSFIEIALPHGCSLNFCIFSEYLSYEHLWMAVSVLLRKLLDYCLWNSTEPKNADVSKINKKSFSLLYWTSGNLIHASRTFVKSIEVPTKVKNFFYH